MRINGWNIYVLKVRLCVVRKSQYKNWQLCFPVICISYWFQVCIVPCSIRYLVLSFYISNWYWNVITQFFFHVHELFPFKGEANSDTPGQPSLLKFIGVELTRGYMLEHDEERYSARREKVYSFMKIPREVEKFMAYGFFQASWKQDVHYLGRVHSS